MQRIQRAFSLFGSSWRVVRHDRELLVLPVISGIVNLIVLGSFSVPGLLSLQDVVVYDATGNASSDFEATSLTYAVAALAYFCGSFVVAFFNAALVVGANDRFEGRDPSLSSAIASASKRSGPLLLWGVLSATAVRVLNHIHEHSGPVGRIIGSMLGHAWAFMSFLVLPSLVIDGVGVGAALHRSSDAVRRTWGENAVGRVSLWSVGFVACPLIGMVAWFGAKAFPTSPTLGVALFVVAALLLLAFVVVTSAMSVVYQTALYRYATDRPIEGFDDFYLAGAFRALQLSRFVR